MAAIVAIATLTVVFPIMIEIKSFLGSFSRTQTCLTLFLLLFAREYKTDSDKEKNAVSDPEKKAENDRSIMKTSA